ncbi:MAG: FmdB family zinc ribbon protein [Desulfobacteraceae bacterium]
MPIYEYKCDRCDRVFECLVIGVGDEVSCPQCSGTDVHRVMSACSFKSGGAYSPASGGGPSCSGCTGGTCSTCH